ncbi:MAG: hypothetical protein JWO08_1887 [Verrucomicrobiaceae bacterium]|nr:hypothetical protein [Verrucomicrobiaceae bacterium]
MTRGGIPQGRATMIQGSAGSGKTVLALQSLVNGARLHNEPGIFVAFEENPQRIAANAATFGWDLAALQKKKLFFLDAQPTPDLVQSGSFDLGGMLAAIEGKVKELGARRIVFDALDVVLGLLDDPAAERREIYRLHEWLLERGLTAIITTKMGGEVGTLPTKAPASMLQFMVDCAMTLNHEMVEGVCQRSLRVIKYRGSSFAENQSPFLIGEIGVEVAGSRELTGRTVNVTSERVSSGVPRLDTMLGGGYFRGASVLVTGSPGTAKSTLCGAFAEAACIRKERTLFVSFDSDPAEIVRNLASVNIRLDRFEKRGLLRLVSARTGLISAEMHFMRIRALAREQKARCLVIDPVSSLSKHGNSPITHSVVERLTDWVKSEGITMVCSSLLDSVTPEVESTPLQISTIADTWIHLSYLVHAGERNRALTIIKSRGTEHSNQVRELMLSNAGITLTDVYTAGGEVLMGTMRWEMEQAELAKQLVVQTESRRQLADLKLAEVDLTGRLKALECELEAKRAERDVLKHSDVLHQSGLVARQLELRGLRGADARKSVRTLVKP